MGERAEFAASLDLRQVDAALEQVRQKSAAAVTANGALATSLTGVERGFAKLSPAMLEVGARVDALRQKQVDLAGALASAGSATQRDAVLVGALRRELEQTTATLNTFGGTQARVAAQGPVWTQNFGALTTGVNATTKGFWSLEGGAKALQQRLAPQAAAISNISATLGENAGQAGKAVAGLGQLAAAYAAGGPLGAGLAATSVGVTLLVQHWDDLIKKQDEALTRSFSGSDGASSLLQKARADVAALHATLSEQGLTQREKNIAAVNREIAGVQAKLDAMRVEGKIWTDNEIAAKKFLETSIEVLRSKQTLAGRTGALADAQGSRPSAAGMPDASGPVRAGEDFWAAQDKAHVAYLDKQDADEERRFDEMMKDREKGLAAMDKAQEKAAAQRAKWDAIELESEKRAWDKKQEIADIAMRKRLRDEEAFATAAMDLTMKAIVDPMRAATSTGLDVFGSYLAMKIKGEENAEEKATAAFMSGIGSQLVGIGTRSLFEGGAKLFNPVTAPIGIAEMAFGGSAIAAGLGLGAAGAAVSHKAAGGSVGVSLPDEERAKRDPGVKPRFEGGGGSRGSGGGGLTIVNNYQVGGPIAEDAARANVDLWRTANRRRMT